MTMEDLLAMPTMPAYSVVEARAWIAETASHYTYTTELRTHKNGVLDGLWDIEYKLFKPQHLREMLCTQYAKCMRDQDRYEYARLDAFEAFVSTLKG